MFFLLNKKPNATPRIIKLCISHKHCVTFLRRTHKVHLLEVLSCDGARTLTNIGGYGVHRDQIYLQPRTIKRRESVPILSDTQVGLHEERSKI